MQGNAHDEEYMDEHGECAREIARLKLTIKTIAEWELSDPKNMDAMNMKRLAQAAVAANS